MTPREHQTNIAKDGYEILKMYGLVYLAMEERTGKTLTSILIAETSKANNILVITKKKAIDGWLDTLSKFKHTKKYDVTNYESLHKLNKAYDLVIVDEAHSNVSAYPVMTKTWKAVYAFTKGKPIILLSATPSAQTYSQLYHQLKLSNWSPWVKLKSFYEWFRIYGIPETKFLAGRQIIVYDKVKPEAFESCKHLFISYTRTELGFEHEPNDVLHYVDLLDTTKKMYNTILKDKYYEVSNTEYVADTPMKLMVGLHQIEGSTLKVTEDLSVNLLGCEKISYILSVFGDTKDMVIFYHYKQEEKFLNIHFKNARILQATSFAEGVDLSMYKTLVIYSMDFSTARYSQRRARQCNMLRGEPIDVHYILVKGGVSEKVYNTVAVNKTNFIDKYFDKDFL